MFHHQLLKHHSFPIELLWHCCWKIISNMCGCISKLCLQLHCSIWLWSHQNPTALIMKLQVLIWISVSLLKFSFVSRLIWLLQHFHFHINWNIVNIYKNTMLMFWLECNWIYRLFGRGLMFITLSLLTNKHATFSNLLRSYFNFLCNSS